MERSGNLFKMLSRIHSNRFPTFVEYDIRHGRMVTVESLPRANGCFFLFTMNHTDLSLKRPMEEAPAASKRLRTENQGLLQPGQPMGPPRTAPLKHVLCIHFFDALHSAGVDVRAEELNLTSSLHLSQSSSYIDRSRHSDFLNHQPLALNIDKVIAQHGLRSFESDVPVLLALGLQDRLRKLLVQMILLEKHRTLPVAVQSDWVGDTLRKLEERDRSWISKQTPAASASTDREKGGKNISETALHRQANVTALQATGGQKKYSWMTSGGSGGGANAISTPQRRKKVEIKEYKEETGQVTIKDALMTMEMDREGNGLISGHGGKSVMEAWMKLPGGSSR
ncbi:Transcription initiation factor TFIID subunit 4 [Neolecta irregularis DAH-3]|uniref:Transcription initiation factor TFIID subunit 4 n=1 Tax=Neolecta irregularis (strain DAH-3) TaxID=1198029 RepID=A0A1U7LQ57_NEOID|nr:Transcription initiation factor TFIID subunit 4 [Neolecta irregularis DAH-3]|eukprot:OLL24682.1 Transcription initiation factor TFIID subunit 4 [Neolecta irregularis DAH-3]